MDDHSPSPDPLNFSLRPGSEATPKPDLLPDEFVPLGLVLQPRGVRVELTKPDVIMGRHSEVDIRLPLPDVSRRHCRFVFTRTGWQIVDLNSLNGIHVNGKRVAHTTLRDHDRLRIASFIFEVELPARSRPVPMTDPAARLEGEHTLPRPSEEKRRAS